MSATYFTLLTTVGETALASATTQDSPLRLTQMAVGDGNGNLPMPDSNQTQLVNERRRAPLNTLSIDPNNPNQIIAEQVLPEDVGGWWIREIGLYDEHDRLIAIGNCPPTYKPQLTEGSGRTQIIRMVLIISHTENVELKIDPAIVLATRQYVDESLAHHAQSRNHPDATLTTSGIVQLNDSISSTSTTQAATANAVKQAYDTGAQAKIRADSAYTLANDKWMAVNASTTRAGIVQLNDSINSTSTTQAATANAVKQAYDTGAQAKIRADSAYTLANGKWMAVNASTTRAGIVQLNDSINSTSTTQAATANAVKQAYDTGAQAKSRADSAYTLANDKWMAVNASTTRAGIVQLNDSINSTSTTQAATANAVKQAYDTGAQAKSRADSAYTLANDKWMAVNASTTRAGIVQLNDSINSTSTTQAATANAVKQAYDTGAQAKNRADSAYTLANDKWMAVNASTTRAGIVQLNDNINSTSTTQAATANAVKQAYDRAVRASQMTRTQLFSGDVGSGYIPLAQNPSNFHELIVIGCADNYWRGIIQVIPVWAARIITETGIAKDIGILYGDEAFWVIRPESFLTTRWEIERENCRIRQVWGVNYG
ncbi:tail fiber protein [Edwardsiella ictaluri]|uniref:Tail fiber protein n=1 Tax=Edwardsiella ictaluri TaxID=67780 RepID=A0ABY8GI63_EDWIC|nr:tail fiber protein [Edwardsiella ictaluri]EKS7806807.1 tail fiber protein [Edwardsiella ictaluri]ELV7529129.1 tail fiber protein [Edwardsiella ictaluri]UCQ50444.1 tail fiber protein [Edwardsiella ictaluri]WFN97106.1 tail fiber protein [Edwardsiella ictaluri]STP83822.1 Phage tail fibre repeat [Edwardsiella ictaluri]